LLESALGVMMGKEMGEYWMGGGRGDGFLGRNDSRVKLGLAVAIKRGELLGLVELAEDGELGWRFCVRQGTRKDGKTF